MSRPPELEKAIAEHAHLREAVDRLDQALHQNPGPEWVQRCRSLADTVMKDLREHFAWEEKGGLFQGASDFARFEVRAAHLMAMHPGLLSKFEAIKEKLEGMVDPSQKVLQDLRQHLRLGIAALRHHEEQENDLVMEAYWDDQGGDD